MAAKLGEGPPVSTTGIDFSRPCRNCADGEHGDCEEGLCGCIVIHEGDSQAVTGFKRIKQGLHPGRAEWTRGGFTPEAKA